jgi:hypothetical protein
MALLIWNEYESGDMYFRFEMTAISEFKRGGLFDPSRLQDVPMDFNYWTDRQTGDNENTELSVKRTSFARPRILLG